PRASARSSTQRPPRTTSTRCSTSGSPRTRVRSSSAVADRLEETRGDRMTDEDEQIKREMAAIEAFDPSKQTRRLTFRWPDAGGNLHDHVFVQGPLGHFATIELGNIVRRVIKDVMDGKYGVDVKELINNRSNLSAARVEV